MVTETKIVVRYAETDQMGVVHHATYPVWFEAARTDFLFKNGYSFQDIENLGLYLPVVDLFCHYISPAHYGEEVIVKTQFDKMTHVKVVFNYEIIRPSTGKTLVTGYSKHCWTNHDMKPVALTRVAPKFYEDLQKIYHEQPAE